MKTKYHILVGFVLCLNNTLTSAQVGINTVTPHSSSILDVTSNDKGMLIPRVALKGTDDTTTINAPQTSLLVYNTATVTGLNAVSPNFYYWDGTMWRLLQGDDWKVTGNDNTLSGTNFIGTTNTEELDFRVNNTLRYRISNKGQLEFFDDANGQSIMIGFEAGENYDPTGGGGHNVFIGYQAGKAGVTSWDMVAIGTKTLTNNTSGDKNTALGSESMEQNTTGNNNTAVGDDSMRLNTSGSDNTAVGQHSLLLNDIGERNTAIGNDALRANEGNNNTALGFEAGDDLISGSDNIFIGTYANTTSNNITRGTALGYNSRVGNADAVAIGENSRALGIRSVAVGSDANASGTDSIGIGDNVSASGDGAIAMGDNALSSGDDSIAIGDNAAASSSDGIAIGDNTVVNFLQSVAIGNGATATKANQLSYGSITEIDQGSAVIVNASDERFKYDIRENVSGLDFVMQLRPVTYKFDVEKYHRFRGMESSVTNSEKTETGFIAQEVETALKLSDYNFNGLIKPEDINKDNYKVSYSLFVVPLVKAVQEQQEEIINQRLLLQKQEVRLQKQQDQIEELKEMFLLLQSETRMAQ